ncbi:PDZ domain-containing protein [Carboxylicivirga marina]|uniref:PDZ domain-containing protein n=1 Tax=Carboxylicivirga marina TaxID=2800988 RepID=A0ABS1HPG1_9BACT|nr:PDZ domain-containing protein [Carboxylicivirga marina]MBK3519567.1 hypothetical protein [Carboxylicivirga marina]
MGLIYYWYGYLIIGSILLIGKAVSCRLAGIYHHHYQIGYSPKLFHIKLWGVTISIGIVIPFPGLFKIFEVHDEGLKKVRPIWMRREHSYLKRLFGISGGAFLIYLAALALNAFVHYNTQHTYISSDDVNANGIFVDSIGHELGFRNGDKILEINGQAYERFTDIKKSLLIDNARDFTVLRNDTVMKLSVTNEDAITDVFTNNARIFSPITIVYPFEIDEVKAGGYADDAGLIKGDQMVSINSDTILYFNDFSKCLKSFANSSVTIGIKRSTSDNILYRNITVSPNGTIGIYLKQSLPTTAEKKSIIQSLNAGNRYIAAYARQLKIIFSAHDESMKVGGFKSIGSLFPEQFHFARIISLMLLSYFCLLIIPTPVSDTRYLIALTIDQFIKLPQKAGKWIGWIVFLPLILIANAIDIIKVFF